MIRFRVFLNRKHQIDTNLNSDLGDKCSKSPMDARDTEFMMLVASQTEDNIAAEDDAYTALLSAAALVVGAENGRQFRINRRHQTRNYLCRPQLLPNPRPGTPWVALFLSRHDPAYITTMGFAVCTMEYMITSRFRRRSLWPL